ncbi:MAG: nucleotide kinase domain-containing protein [Fluviibacter sp.]
MRDTCPYERPTAETVCSYAGYLWFCWEREAIRLGRENGLPRESWTADPVMQKYRFTNIRRRDDRMTRWFIEHLIEPAVTNGDMNLWFTLLVGRLLNWPPTLQALLDFCVLPAGPENFDPERFVQVVESCKEDGAKVFGGAYMVYPGTGTYALKSEFLAYEVLRSARQRADLIDAALWAAGEEPSIERFTTQLARCFGVSTFMAGQVAADMSYTPGVLGEATDLYTWAPLGPGSQKGLNYLNRRDLQKSWRQFDFNAALIEANSLICGELDITDLTLHDVQNTMCEFSKYAGAILGESTPKTLYTPEGAY